MDSDVGEMGQQQQKPKVIPHDRPCTLRQVAFFVYVQLEIGFAFIIPLNLI
jgi:hypothetical protein